MTLKLNCGLNSFSGSSGTTLIKIVIICHKRKTTRKMLRRSREGLITQGTFLKWATKLKKNNSKVKLFYAKTTCDAQTLTLKLPLSIGCFDELFKAYSCALKGMIQAASADWKKTRKVKNWLWLRLQHSKISKLFRPLWRFKFQTLF